MHLKHGNRIRHMHTDLYTQPCLEHGDGGNHMDTYLYTQPSRPPDSRVEKWGSVARVQTLSVCRARVCRHRCWPRSQTRMVRSAAPEMHTRPSLSSSTALRTTMALRSAQKVQAGRMLNFWNIP